MRYGCIRARAAECSAVSGCNVSQYPKHRGTSGGELPRSPGSSSRVTGTTARWLDDDAPISVYASAVKRKRVFELRRKPRPVRIKLLDDHGSRPFYFDASMLVRHVKEELAARVNERFAEARQHDVRNLTVSTTATGATNAATGIAATTIVTAAPASTTAVASSTAAGATASATATASTSTANGSIDGALNKPAVPPLQLSAAHSSPGSRRSSSLSTVSCNNWAIEIMVVCPV